MNQLVENLKNNPSILIGIVALVICLGFGFLRSNQLTELSLAESELNTKLDKINFNVRNSENIEEDIQQLEGLKSAIDERLFIGEERSTNIDFFYSFEEKLDITISEVNQLERGNSRYSGEGPDELKLYSVVDYSITVSGTFHELLRFLYEIYQIDTIARVTKYEIYSAINGKTDELSAKVQVAVLATK